MLGQGLVLTQTAFEGPLPVPAALAVVSAWKPPHAWLWRLWPPWEMDVNRI